MLPLGDLAMLGMKGVIFIFHVCALILFASGAEQCNNNSDVNAAMVRVSNLFQNIF